MYVNASLGSEVLINITTLIVSCMQPSHNAHLAVLGFRTSYGIVFTSILDTLKWFPVGSFTVTIQLSSSTLYNEIVFIRSL